MRPPVDAWRTWVMNVVDVGAARVAARTPVLEGGDRLLVEHRRSVGGEVAEAGAVGVADALRHHAVGRLEQPEARVHALWRRAQSEQAAHVSGRSVVEPGLGRVVHRRGLLLQAHQLALEVVEQHVGQVVGEAAPHDDAQRREVGAVAGNV